MKKTIVAAAIVMLILAACPRFIFADGARGAGFHLGKKQAVTLGLVEGLTEYLPVSSTGHLILAQRIMGIGESGPAKDAADAYAIVIQIGAILAVFALYFGRIRSMVMGLLGRDNKGKRVAFGVIVAFLPAAAIGVVLEKHIKHHLFGMWPVTAAWFVGGVALLVMARLYKDPNKGLALENLTLRGALLIGAAQCFAMWPGTSRSLVTIIGGVVAGLTLPAAVEFSFLLGLVTLSAATAFEGAKQGGHIIAAYGLLTPLLGVAVAFISAVFAVKFMVSFLTRNAMTWFGVYRVVLALAVMAALLTRRF